jgi:hypothetical protein
MFKKVIAMSLLCFAAVLSGYAQCDFDPSSDGKVYRVRNVTVNALFGKIPRPLRDKLAKHRGEIFRGAGGPDEGSLSKLQLEVRKYLEEKSEILPDTSLGLSKNGGIYIRATFSAPCAKVVPREVCLKEVVDANGSPVENCLDVAIRYTVIPVNTANPAANILDLARSNQLRFYRELPSPLLAFDPSFGIENDTTYGTSLVGSIKADLLSLASTLAGSKPEGRTTTLLLTANGRKSLKLPLFNADATVLFSHSRPGSRFASVVIGGGYSTERDGRGSSLLRKESANIRADAELMLRTRFVNQLTFGLDYRHRRTRFERVGGIVENSVEDFLSSRVVTDGKIGNGFFRGAAWIDNASPTSGPRYTRFATQFGYAANFSTKNDICKIVTDEEGARCAFAKTNPPVFSLETVFGLGRSWGTVPEHARYFGGNGGGNFLYDTHDAQTMIDAPTGPLIRSIGRNRAGASFSPDGSIGGTSYEFLNVSLSIPVRSWSRPLIPSIAIIDRPIGEGGCDGCSSLKSVLKNQVASGKELYLGTLAWQSLTDQQRVDFDLSNKPDRTPEEDARLAAAEAAYDAAIVKFTPKAEAVWEEITPTVHFIADKANLYSFKPLFMVDVARISARGEPPGKLRMGMGAGLQVNVVIAKFELGYIRTIRGLPSDGKGNFVIRTVFERLF